MKKIILIFIAVFYSTMSFADIRYVVGKNKSDMPGVEQIKRAYLSFGYNLHFADNYSGAEIKSFTSAPSFALGFRFDENVRAEVSYDGLNDDYVYGVNDFSTSMRYAFVNVLFDTKLPKEYRLFGTDPLVPFVGFGIGFGMADASGGAFSKPVQSAYNFIGGASIEINKTTALVFTYKYIKNLPNDLALANMGNVIKRFAPASQNVGVGLRFSF